MNCKQKKTPGAHKNPSKTSKTVADMSAKARLTSSIKIKLRKEKPIPKVTRKELTEFSKDFLDSMLPSAFDLKASEEVMLLAPVLCYFDPAKIN